MENSTKIEEAAGEVSYFTQSLPATQSATDSPGLLRWVAQSIEEITDIELVDLSYGRAYTPESNPSLGIFFRSKRTKKEDALRYITITMHGETSGSAADLLQAMANKSQELGISLADIGGITFQNTLDKKGGDAYQLTIYY